MNKIIEKENITIEDMIYEVSGVQVILSSDVAKLYQVETKVLNQVINRNINRFSERFCFQLNNTEIDNLSLRSQFVTLNKNNNKIKILKILYFFNF
ncbi:MAG: ORF6N domain-containing protein [Bacilli bacterium]|nr:ORF6N domain-containing protein [Bacilli bacterium]